MSLQGKRIVVTRAPHQAGKLAGLLRERSAEPLLFPCIDVVPPEDTTEIDKALHNLSQFDWLVLTSANTVVALEKRLAALQIDKRELAHIKVAVVGRKTKKSAEKRLGIVADIMPGEQVAEGLATAMPDITGKNIFLPQSDIARDVLRHLLSEAGAVVTAVDAYRTVTATGGVSVDEVRAADVITFTSPSTVNGFVERMGTALNIPSVCIGPITSDAARETGFTQVIEPDKDYSLGGMLNVLESYFGEQVYDDSR